MSKSWLALLIAVPFLLALPAAAQQPGPENGSGSNIPGPGRGDFPSTSEELAKQGLFKIDFPGGTVEEYVKLVKELADKNGIAPANIVMPGPKPTFTFELPSIQVIADVRGALECLSACSTARVDIDVSESDSGNITFVRISEFLPSISNSPSAGIAVQVFNLKRILMEMPKENVVSAINLGLEISTSVGDTEIKLHEETGLLFAKGNAMDLGIIANIVDELTKSVEQMNAFRNPFPIGGSGGSGHSHMPETSLGPLPVPTGNERNDAVPPDQTVPPIKK